MAGNQKRTLDMATRKQVGPCGQANGGNGRRSSSGLRSEYMAQGPVPGLMYALTMNGYIVL